MPSSPNRLRYSAVVREVEPDRHEPAPTTEPESAPPTKPESILPTEPESALSTEPVVQEGQPSCEQGEEDKVSERHHGRQ